MWASWWSHLRQSQTEWYTNVLVSKRLCHCEQVIVRYLRTSDQARLLRLAHHGLCSGVRKRSSSSSRHGLILVSPLRWASMSLPETLPWTTINTLSLWRSIKMTSVELIECQVANEALETTSSTELVTRSPMAVASCTKLTSRTQWGQISCHFAQKECKKVYGSFKRLNMYRVYLFSQAIPSATVSKHSSRMRAGPSHLLHRTSQNRCPHH